MKSYPHLRRWFSALSTVAVFAVVVIVVSCSRRSPTLLNKTEDDPAKEALARAWPLFGGSANRNAVNLTDKNIPSAWNIEKGQEKNLKWIAPLGSRAYGGPVIAGGKVFVGTNNNSPRNPDIKGDKGILMCFRESDGQFLWQAVHDKLLGSKVNDWPEEGVCSTPVVEGNRLYYVSNRCEIICADTEGFLDGTNDGVQDEKYKGKTDADIIWRLDMMKELGVFPHNLAASSPVIVGNLLFVVTGNGVDEGHRNLPKPQAPSFIAVDKNTGKVKWQDNSPGEKVIHGQWSSPVYAVIRDRPQVIFGGGDGWLRAFEPATGKLIWTFDCNPKASKYTLGAAGTRNDLLATPVVHDEKVYVGVGQDPEHYEGVGHLWCIDPAKATDGHTDLSPVNDNFDPRADVNKDSGLVWHFGGPAGEKSDRPYTFGRTTSNCTIHEGLLYVADLTGIIYCLDAKTGEKYWDHETNGAVWGSPFWVDGKVYLGNEDGTVFVFAHGKEKKRLLGQMDMGGKKIRSTIVAANGVLYVMTETNLYAIAANKD